MSTKKKSTKKVAIEVPSELKTQEMFTTDPDKIRAYIASSRQYTGSIDPDVIVKINVKTHKLMSVFDYTEFLSTITEDEYEMLLQFQNILDKDERITKILQKKHTSEEDELYMMNWNTSKYGHYMMAQQLEEPDVFDEADFIR
jgi:hypothetical protein